MKAYKQGFTLIEILVTISIIAVLSAVLYATFSDGESISRDSERRANLLRVQAAIEQYRADHGRYPQRCTNTHNDVNADSWSGQLGSDYECDNGTNEYIVGLIPDYLQNLPLDRQVPDTDAGYTYTVNAEGSVYKLAARRTVETHELDSNDDFAFCPMQYTHFPNAPTPGALFCDQDFSNGGNRRADCQDNSDVMDHSYAVWGGRATGHTGNPASLSATGEESSVRRTQRVACHGTP